MLLYCEWQSKPVNCSDIFQLVPSNQGFCCVYNLQTVHLNRKRYIKNLKRNEFLVSCSVQRFFGWIRPERRENRQLKIERGWCYENRNRAVPVGQQPVKAHGEGVQMGLTVLLDAQIDDYALTSSFFHGFKVTHFAKPLVEILVLKDYLFYSHLNQLPIFITVEFKKKQKQKQPQNYSGVNPPSGRPAWSVDQGLRR